MTTMVSVVIMGVAGCGKSSLAAAVAQGMNVLCVEGDDYHSAHNRKKMQQGLALTDADRDGWLAALCQLLAHSTQGVVLSCSALKRAYRDRLRQASPGLLFVFLDIPRAQALARVAARPQHFFSASLVDDQFATLESPLGEAGVLHLDACASLLHLQQATLHWLATQTEVI